MTRSGYGKGMKFQPGKRSNTQKKVSGKPVGPIKINPTKKRGGSNR